MTESLILTGGAFVVAGQSGGGLMVSHPFECEFCHQLWTNPIAAALCCDPAAHGEAD